MKKKSLIETNPYLKALKESNALKAAIEEHVRGSFAIEGIRLPRKSTKPKNDKKNA